MLSPKELVGRVRSKAGGTIGRMGDGGRPSKGLVAKIAAVGVVTLAVVLASRRIPRD